MVGGKAVEQMLCQLILNKRETMNKRLSLHDIGELSATGGVCPIDKVEQLQATRTILLVIKGRVELKVAFFLAVHCADKSQQCIGSHKQSGYWL